MKDLKAGDIVKVTTNCVPPGLVPDKIVQLHYEYAADGSTKWYAVETNQCDYVATIDRQKIYLLKPQLKS